MTQVSKTNSNKELQLPMVGGAVPAISTSDKEVLLAFSSKKIGEMKTHEVGSVLNNTISRAYYHAGHAIPNQKELLALQIYLADFLKTENVYQNICIDEITIALKRGSDKQYGEFFGIGPGTITGWIRAFIESESRKAAKLMEQTIMLSQQVKPEPTLAEQKEAFISRLEQLYEDYKQVRAILPTEGTFYFEKLYTAKVIRLTDEQRNELKKVAYDRLVKAKNPSKSQTKADYNKMKIVYQAFITAGMEGNDVKREAMYLGLLDWFKGLADFDIAIRDEIV
jgi:hypothetical protein